MLLCTLVNKRLVAATMEGGTISKCWPWRAADGHMTDHRLVHMGERDSSNGPCLVEANRRYETFRLRTLAKKMNRMRVIAVYGPEPDSQNAMLIP